jgi:hypothetical protein
MQDVIPDGLDGAHSLREPLSSACSRLGDLPCGFSVVRSKADISSFNLHAVVSQSRLRPPLTLRNLCRKNPSRFYLICDFQLEELSIFPVIPLASSEAR